ncbi:hypothetical protein [Waltera acetigignens]
MLLRKKIGARGIQSEEDTTMDFPWLYQMGVTCLGFTHRTVRQQYMGLWMDLFEIYKRHHNFQAKRGLFSVVNEDKEEEISTLDVL